MEACVGWPLPNVWLGVTAEDQTTADERIPVLLRTPAAKRFVSAEPLLGPVDLQNYLKAPWMPDRIVKPFSQPIEYLPVIGINWVITGGESGPGARPSHPDWFRSLRDQCVATGVPFHFKQWGDWSFLNCSISTWIPARHEFEDGIALWHVGKKSAGRLLDGVEWSQFPEATHA